MVNEFLLGAVLTMQAAGASPPPPDPQMELQRNVLPFSETAPGQFRGAGWDRLIADGAKSHFFMIGEQHATADIAIFGQSVQSALARRGYTHAAYEIGPYSTDFAERLVRSGKGKLAAYIRQPGNAIALPFLFYQEEVDLAEQIVAASPDKTDALWGLDQEFVGAGPIVIELLRGWANSPEERAAADAFAEKVTSNAQLIGTAHWSEMVPIERAFSGNPQGAKFIAELKLSNEIYAPFTGRGGFGYDGNLRRENYLKINFAKRFAAAEKRNGRAPKVFLKFGGYHAQKGFTGTNVPGLGNFLYEWGLPRGFGLTNVMVECVGGNVLNPQTNQTAPCQPYFNKDSAIAKLPKPNRHTLVDLRPLRPLLGRMPNLDQESRQLILSFDYYLAIRDVKAATPVARQP